MASDLPPGNVPSNLMHRVDRAIRTLRGAVARHSPDVLRRVWNGAGIAVNRRLPSGLLGRSLLIIVLPMLILMAVLTGVFMDRHWAMVTDRLSTAVTRDIGALVAVAEMPLGEQEKQTVLARVAAPLALNVELLPPGQIGRSSVDFVDIVHRMLGEKLATQIHRPFAIRTHDDGQEIEVRLALTDATLRVWFQRSLAYATNWHFFLVWMASTALVLILISVIFIRNQIKPIQRLADAADAIGRGQLALEFSPSGAREVRKAAHAFIGMRRRIERQIEQRTTMLAGVSHDLRTILTRFKLELALQPEMEESAAMRADVSEMEAMLNAYLDFARGDVDEPAQEVDLDGLLTASARSFDDGRADIGVEASGCQPVVVRPTAFRRLVDNIVSNAVRYGGGHVFIRVEQREGWTSIMVDDDGAGIPDDEREAVFRAFYRRDEARNQDIPGTGLGLSIARDVARSHGGEISLAVSPEGGLRVIVRLPGFRLPG